MIIKNIEDYFENLAPSHLALDYDNVGLLIGDENVEITSILLCLDVTKEVIQEAININANLIISHHPLIFSSIKKINNKKWDTRLAMELIKNNIALFTSHTNLDMCNTGTNDILAQKINLQNVKIIKKNEEDVYGLGRIGHIKSPQTLKDFAKHVKQCLNVDGVKIVGDENAVIKNVAVSSGSGNDTGIFDTVLKNGADVLVTGDITFHKAQYALYHGLHIVDATHYATEVIVLDYLKEIMEKTFKETNIYVTKTNGQVFKTI